MKARGVVGVVLALSLAGGASPAFAWSFTGDPDGERLDREARHVLTTQNVCGVVLKDRYLVGLMTKIEKHFGKDADYSLYLRRSVLSANAEYLAEADEAKVAAECRKRVDEARRKGILAE